MILLQDINKNLLQAEYAVRGTVPTRAQELEKQGKKIIYCNIGNPQLFKQKPLTYVREVLSLLEFPQLLERTSTIKQLFHADSIQKAQYILQQVPEGIGAYTPSEGLKIVREAIAKFITLRDNIPASPEHIIVTDGASKAIQLILQAIIKSPQHGVLIPIPQYPLYSATLTLLDGKRVDYLLDEINNWQLNLDVLEESIIQAKAKQITPVAITVINPNNPTGSVLSHDNIKMVINFAKKHNLAILADEVYQENIYNDAKFYSFAKIMHELNIDDVSLFSFYSMSKGYFGECGHRSGYVEIRNVPHSVLKQIIKLQSINLCANAIGQIATYLMVSPPKDHEESYPLYKAEKTAILSDLQEKSIMLNQELNKIPGISVSQPQGAMYAFVKLNLPQPNINNNNISQDEQYCLELLEETGICVVPGSGFGQAPGTLHFRTTLLPPKEEIINLVEKLKEFHLKYITKSSTNI